MFIHCGEMEKSVEHSFCYSLLVCLLCELIEGYMVFMLHRQLLLLKASTIYRNVCPLDKKILCVSLFVSCDVHGGMDDKD